MKLTRGSHTLQLLWAELAACRGGFLLSSQVSPPHFPSVQINLCYKASLPLPRGALSSISLSPLPSQLIHKISPHLLALSHSAAASPPSCSTAPVHLWHSRILQVYLTETPDVADSPLVPTPYSYYLLIGLELVPVFLLCWQMNLLFFFWSTRAREICFFATHLSPITAISFLSFTCFCSLLSLLVFELLSLFNRIF